MTSTESPMKDAVVPTAPSTEHHVSVESGGPVDIRSTATMQSRRSTGTLLIVIASLFFVAVFGGSLIGGIVTGDPNNVYFTIIVVFAMLAICIVGTLAVKTMNYEPSDRTLQDKTTDLRNTFTSRSDEERNEDMLHGRDRYLPERTPVMREIRAGSVAGDMSALSPHSYEGELSSKYRRDDPSDCNTEKHTQNKEKSANRSRRGPFDFSSIASSRSKRKMRRKEDPPEAIPPQNSRLYQSQSRDPAAAKVSHEGDLIQEDEGITGHSRMTNYSNQVSIDYDSTKTPTAHVHNAREADIHSLMKIHSTKNAANTPREPSIHNHNDPDGFEVDVSISLPVQIVN
jgi:hypothetical protein